MMQTQTREVSTMLQTTAMVMMPTVVRSLRQPSACRMLTWLCARSVPSVLDISHVYFPASSSTTFLTISSWLPEVKWCLSVTTRGWSPFSQVMRGGGLPVALHWRATVSPTDTTWSSSGWTKDGVSAGRQTQKLIFRDSVTTDLTALDVPRVPADTAMLQAGTCSGIWQLHTTDLTTTAKAPLPTTNWC